MSTTTKAEPRNVTGVEIRGPLREGYDQILSPDALEFMADLVRRFRPTLEALLKGRAERQTALEAGAGLDFMPETASIREGAWTVAPLPAAAVVSLLWQPRRQCRGCVRSG